MKKIIIYDTEIIENKPQLVEKQVVDVESTEVMDSPEKIHQLFNTVFHLGRKTEKYVYLIGFNTKNKILGIFELAHGTINQAILQPREIMMRLLLLNAESFSVVFNNPSQDVTPSESVINVSSTIEDAADLMYVRLIDFIIVSEKEYCSFRDKGLIK